MAKKDGLDGFLSAVGLGKWQLPYIALFCFVTWVIPVHMIGSTLLSAPVLYRCSYKNDTENYIYSPEMRNETAVWNDNNPYYDNKCLEIKDWNDSYEEETAKFKSVDLVSCPNVKYDSSVFTSTIITEWNLICERDVFRPLFQMMYSIGSVCGAIFGGPASDHFGRKRAVQVASIITFLVTTGMYFIPWYVGLLILRIIMGAASNCMVLASYNLALETVPAESRSWIGVLIGISFSFGILGFSAVGYFIRSWRNLMLVSSSALLILIPLSFFIQESPRWLLHNGNEEKVMEIMVKAAKVNGRCFNPDVKAAIDVIRQQAETKQKSPQKQKTSIRSYLKSSSESLRMYFYSSPMRIIFIVTPLVWLLQNSLYLGIILNANNFTGSNPFAYVAVSGAMDGLAILLATPFTMKLGRRSSLIICFIGGSILLMLDLLIPTGLWWMSWMLVMISLLLIAAAVQINFLFTSELFPTPIRARGFAWAHFAGNIGFVLAPLVTDLLSQIAWWSVSITFGCAGLIAGLLIPILPETNNRPLPETIMSVEERYLDNRLKRKKKKRDSILKNEKVEASPAQEHESLRLFEDH